jgi:hypothetical protein
MCLSRGNIASIIITDLFCMSCLSFGKIRICLFENVRHWCANAELAYLPEGTVPMTGLCRQLCDQQVRISTGSIPGEQLLVWSQVLQVHSANQAATQK